MIEKTQFFDNIPSAFSFHLGQPGDDGGPLWYIVEPPYTFYPWIFIGQVKERSGDLRGIQLVIGPLLIIYAWRK